MLAAVATQTPPRDPRSQELLDLILEVSFRRQKVTLSSGKESDFYLDLRQTLMRPRGIALAGELVLERLADGPPVQSVGGMAVGAVPLVSAVLAAGLRPDLARGVLLADASPYLTVGDRQVRAVPAQGAVPQAYLSGLEAEAACVAAGKRLCTSGEWLANWPKNGQK